MANSYTAIPNIVPGNLTVNGNLKVSGGQIAVGKFQRQYRIQEMANGQFVETVNVDKLAGTQDVPSMASLMRVIYPDGPPFAVATQPAGSPMTDTYLLNQQPNAFIVASEEFRVGMVTPYVRLFNVPPNLGYWSVNLQPDRITRDDPTQRGFSLIGNNPQGGFTAAMIDTAANTIAGELPRVFWLDHTNHTMTGTTALQTVATKVIYGNQLGPNGGIHLTITAGFATVAGGQCTVAVYLGSQNIVLAVFGASLGYSFITEVFIRNAGAINSQTTHARTQYSTTSTVINDVSSSVDTTLNQTLGITVQNGNNADVCAVKTIEAAFIARNTGV